MATCEYSPFGRTLVAHGLLADENPIRFSSKYAEDAHGSGEPTGPELTYYGYRYYKPDLGRWVSRDPIEERGGVNHLAFCTEDPVNALDALGDSSFTECMVKELVNGILPPGAPKLKYDPPKVTLYVRVGLQYACVPGGLVWGLRKAVRVKIEGEDCGWRSEEKYAAAGFCGKSGDHDAYCSCCSW